MSIYYVNVIFFAILVLAGARLTSAINGRILLALLLYLTALDGLRWSTGTDWLPYYEHFEFGEASFSVEIGYEVLASVLRSAGLGYSALLLLISFLTYFSIFGRVYALGGGWIGVMLLYSALTPYLGANRQILAVCVLVWAIEPAIRRELPVFLITVLLAALFHVSALMFLPVYFLFGRSGRYVLAYSSLVLVGCLLVGGGGEYLRVIGEVISPKFEGYIEAPRDLSAGGWLALVKMFSLLAVPAFIVWCSGGFRASRDDLRAQFFSNCVMFYGLIYVAALVGVPALNSRGGIYYFGLFYPLLWGSLASRVGGRGMSFLYRGVAVVVAFLILHSGLSYYSDLFEPYESIVNDPPYKNTY